MGKLSFSTTRDSVDGGRPWASGSATRKPKNENRKPPPGISAWAWPTVPLSVLGGTEDLGIEAFWGEYKVQIILWIAVVLLAFLILNRIFGLLRLAICLAIGAALGWGTAWVLQYAGVSGSIAYFAATAITVAVLLVGMRRRRR